METETESDPAVNPTLQSPLTGLGMERIEAETESEAGLYEQTPVGVAMALSWTCTGGSTSYMETRFIEEGDAIGCLYVMGQVGEKTLESVDIAYIVAKQTLLKKQPGNTFFVNSMLRLDLPCGDGTSAGCTMATSLLSLAMKKPVGKNLAMTGTVTPSGKILRIGSVSEEKTIGARQSQVKTIIFPEANRADFDELPDKLKEGVDVHFVDEYEQIFEIAFGYDEIEVRAEDETDESKLASFVGKPVLYEKKQTHVGVAMYLATTYIGGLAMCVKTSLDDEGKGCLYFVGQLGERMIESVCIAHDLAYQILLHKKPHNTFFTDSVLSIYLPASSKNKGTSAGCAVVTAFLSLAMKKPVRKDLAMTGEVTQTGTILGTGNVSPLLYNTLLTIKSLWKSHYPLLIHKKAPALEQTIINLVTEKLPSPATLIVDQLRRWWDKQLIHRSILVIAPFSRLHTTKSYHSNGLSSFNT